MTSTRRLRRLVSANDWTRILAGPRVHTDGFPLFPRAVLGEGLRAQGGPELRGAALPCVTMERHTLSRFGSSRLLSHGAARSEAERGITNARARVRLGVHRCNLPPTSLLRRHRRAASQSCSGPWSSHSSHVSRTALGRMGVCFCKRASGQLPGRATLPLVACPPRAPKARPRAGEAGEASCCRSFGAGTSFSC